MTRKKPPQTHLPHESVTQPTHFLLMKTKGELGKATRVGALWLNTKGGLSLKLNKGVSLSWRDCLDCWLTIWPNDNSDGAPNDEVPF